MPSTQTSIAFIAGLMLLAANIPATIASPPDVTFLCGRMPEVCTNMCWAVRCANPTFTKALTWDDPSDQVKADRRKSAGCGSGNKCNAGKRGVGHRGTGYESCDEYPFATTANADRGHQVSRCVPGRQNSRQGNALKQAYRRFRNNGFTRHSLKVNFGNPGSRGVKYCTNQPCRNDGYEVQDKQLKRRSEDPEFLFYRTFSGIVLGSMEPNEFPSNYTRIADEEEILPIELDSWFEDVDGEELRMVNDVIIGELSVADLGGEE